MDQLTLFRTGICQECGLGFPVGLAGRIAAKCQQCRMKRPKCRGCGGPIPLTWRGGPRGGFVVSGYYCSDGCKPRCSIEGCEKPRRKRGWCANHYATWRDHGDPEAEPAYRWAVRAACVACGIAGDDPQWTHQSRRFCSHNCQQLWRKHKGNVPAVIACAVCGDEVPLVRSDGSRRRSDTSFCDMHARHGRQRITAQQLAAEDGAWCRLCGDSIDMTIKSPHPRSPSVDHIIPRALGGSDDRENLQLACRGCNSSKRHRYVG